MTDPIFPGGILIPCVPYRFRVRASCFNKDPDLIRLFSGNIASCEVDYMAKQVRIISRFPASPQYPYVITMLENTGLSIDFMASDDNIHFSIMPRMDCGNPKMIKSEFRLDYAQAGVLYHHLTYEFTDFLVISPSAQDDIITPREGDMTPQEAVAKIQAEKATSEKPKEQTNEGQTTN